MIEHLGRSEAKLSADRLCGRLIVLLYHRRRTGKVAEEMHYPSLYISKFMVFDDAINGGH